MSYYNPTLQFTPLTLANTIRRKKSPARLLRMLNKTLSLPAFTATSPGWAGASHQLAKCDYTSTGAWSIMMPVAKRLDFVLCIRWIDEDDVVHRYKLWENVDEILAYPLYTGERIPAGNARFEFWSTLAGADGFTITAPIVLDIGEVEMPTDFADTTATGTEIATACLTHSTTPSTLTEYLEKCYA